MLSNARQDQNRALSREDGVLTTPTPGSHCSTILEIKLGGQATSWLPLPRPETGQGIFSFSLLSRSHGISVPVQVAGLPLPTRSPLSHQRPLTAIRKLGELTEDSESQEMQEQQCRPGLGVGEGVAISSLPTGPHVSPGLTVAQPVHTQLCS